METLTEKAPALRFAATASIAPYAASIFTSATLLFLIQPMIAKQLLPWFGGAASVWTACMMFFQTVLLFGYLYAHWSIRTLSHRAQLAAHIALLALSAAVIWVSLGVRLHPASLDRPVYRALIALAGSIGLPYFVLSSTTPLLQSWYSRTRPGAAQYRLFALSNLGALLALLAYPFAIEPALEIRPQLALWRVGYILFAAACAAAAIRTPRAQVDSPTLESPFQGAGLRQKFVWVLLAACSSTLLLAVTNKLGQDIAPVPLVWIAPLAVYLISFIFCFDRECRHRTGLYRVLLPAALVALIWLGTSAGVGIGIALSVCLAGLFTVCMFCHGQLAQLKPASRGQTSFYLCISLGGALGGLFVGLLAPAIFSDFFELQVGVSLGLVLGLRFLFGYRSMRFLTACGLAALVSLRFFSGMGGAGTVTSQARNFYGVVAIREDVNLQAGRVRTLVHGGTIHGGQVLTDEHARREPRYYYGRESGVGLVLGRQLLNRRVGVVGLGVGTVAAYGRQGDYYRFYELNPLVESLARTNFTYLHDSAATVDVVLGDARLSLESEPNRNFDVLVLDAFSGDAIPIHLLTREAFQCYFRHVKPGGIIAVHTSNVYLNLAPVVARVAASFGRQAFRVMSAARPEQQISAAEWVLVTANQELATGIGQRYGEVLHAENTRLWTDRYSNILGALR
jgi:spermidine synthase